MKYINYKYNSVSETIDEAETIREAIYLLNEYRISDNTGNYWISRKPCKN